MQNFKLRLNTVIFIIFLFLNPSCKKDEDPLPKNYLKIDDKVFELVAGYIDDVPNEFLDINSNKGFTHEISLTTSPFPFRGGESGISLYPFSSQNDLPSGLYEFNGGKAMDGFLFDVLGCENYSSSKGGCINQYKPKDCRLQIDILKDGTNRLLNKYTIKFSGSLTLGFSTNSKEVKVDLFFEGGISRINL